MARVEMVMPKLGESIMEATIISWTKKTGEFVEAEETVLEIATDKVDSEVPSPVSGVLQELLFKDGDVVPVGTVIAILETAAASANAPSTAKPAETLTAPIASPTPEPALVFGANAPVAAVAQSVGVINPTLASAIMPEPVRGRFYSPLVLNIANEEKISMDELDRIPGTGNEGRVTKKDILAYVELRKSGQIAAPVAVPINSPSAVPAAATTPPVSHGGSSQTGYTSSNNGSGNASALPKKTFSISGEVEIIEMDRMRKMIAENMVYSKHTAPHVTSFVEADVTNLVIWRDKIKNQFEKQYNQKLTFTPIFVEAIARALREMPLLNSAVDGDKIILRKDINIGVAVALPSGNLIVPVIKKADQFNLVGLAAATNALVEKARNNKLLPDDLADGTYTVSNVGTFGNLMGTPIILQPQVGVMATGSIKKKPAVIETPSGDLIGIRQMMFLSHSYDHRIIDGALGGKFVRRVADILESWDVNRPV